MRLELIYEPYNFEEKENWLPPSDSRYCQIHNDSMILQLCNSLDVCANFEILLRLTRAHWRHPAIENLNVKSKYVWPRSWLRWSRDLCLDLFSTFWYFQKFSHLKIFGTLFQNNLWRWVLENIPFISSSSVEFIVNECSLIPFGEMLFRFGSTAAFACCSKICC